VGVIDDPLAIGMLDGGWTVAARILGLAPLRRLAAERAFLAIAARTLALNDFVTEAVAAGVSQVVTLGAGLDGRAVRLAANGVTYFEVDDRATQEHKQSVASKLPFDWPARFVAADLTAPTWGRVLITAGMKPQQPTAFISEGVSMYLTAEDNAAVLTTASRLCSGRASLAVHVACENQPGAVAPPPGARAMTQVVARLTRSEPIRWLPDPSEARAVVASSGWNIRGCADLQTLWSSRSIASSDPPRAALTSAFIIEAVRA
jgi:methyltransferase (TIGR00027 family)